MAAASPIVLISMIPSALRNIALRAVLPFGYFIASICLPKNSLFIPFMALIPAYTPAMRKSLRKPTGFLLPKANGVKNSGREAKATIGIMVTVVKFINHCMKRLAPKKDESILYL